MNFHKLIIIGVLFQFFDINFGNFDIFPDFIGFIIIVYALSKVNAQYTNLGMFCATILAVMSIMGIVLPEMVVPSANLALQIVAILNGLLTILYLACIFSVSKEILRGEESMFPTLYISLQLIFLLFSSVGMHFPLEVYEILGLSSTVLLFFFYIYFIVFLWKRKNKESALFDEVMDY
ncbi:hypothetical protein H9635_05920 [Solibacillus sp. A46]|uniref:Uncharacterized protein n=1 Tax=Solibacillus faecavium TaxID=2762221 RepID=A0ABR8XWF0_9BACL|nr:hypothetical protein [Solibacillus faecavium]MBD8036274.1 hypothetical protein [Solibacillus faecavium]